MLALFTSTVDGRTKMMPSKLSPVVYTVIWTATSVLGLLIVQQLRFRRAKRNIELFKESNADPELCRQVMCSIAFYEFPLVYRLSLEFALFRTYSIPSISGLLEKTKVFERQCGKRYDDTDLLISEITQNPFDSERSRLAMERLNAIHSQHTISNEDMLYVLSVFILEPIRWINKIEWRKLSPEESDAFYLVWKYIGEQMGIANIPGSLEEFVTWNKQYEKAKLVFHPSNLTIANATIDLFLGVVPSFLHSLGRKVAYCLMDEPLLRAIDAPDPSPGLQNVVYGVLAIRATLIRLLLPPRLRTTRRTLATPRSTSPSLCPRYHVYERTYAKGYEIEQLGAAPKGKLMKSIPKYI